MLVCVSQPNLLNYSTDWDEIWCVNVFLSVDMSPKFKKNSVRSLFSKKIDFETKGVNRKGFKYYYFYATDIFIWINVKSIHENNIRPLRLRPFVWLHRRVVVWQKEMGSNSARLMTHDSTDCNEIWCVNVLFVLRPEFILKDSRSIIIFVEIQLFRKC